MNFSGILIGVLTFFLIGLFHPIVIYAEYYFGSRCWPVFLLVGILCMILSVRMQEILWSASHLPFRIIFSFFSKCCCGPSAFRSL